ncbi:hypothetical protein TrispH2_009837 [Trichoplax sp. H2]|uniref:Uncharacterized protein n=1 Tax=Trichoplax adhaerens TaxID=10228 RepID=B3SBU5_TRIAD|nr:hypothetical protein TRIADDRAFT_61739 [Trichoplax adhaerens]EDV19821.1 hypothetical protein TRIADDRAFT_61739 [Trichoplax adhaerens]RDD38187.1 hypothetical protein TrispH2_009837 [Trichoplax sp. H2]|eukprot:XP_002117691.1 hypothetical protein TRIADDRAFT_61739 [Trichoplax adhaerens]
MDLVDNPVEYKLMTMLKAYQVNRFDRLTYNEGKIWSLKCIEQLQQQIQANDIDNKHQVNHQIYYLLSYHYYNLGRIYQLGLGTTNIDQSQASKYYKLAAGENHPSAIYQLGKLCGCTGCDYEYTKQLKNQRQVAIYRVRQFVASAAIDPWCCQADDELTKCCKADKMYYNALYNQKMTYKRLLSTYQDDEDDKNLRDQMVQIPRHSSKPHQHDRVLVKLSSLYCQLGYMMIKLNQLHGENIDLTAYQYFSKAAKLGNASGFINIAIWKYSHGYGSPKDSEHCIQLFIKASQYNSPQAHFYLLQHCYEKYISTANIRQANLAVTHSSLALAYPFASPLFYIASLFWLGGTDSIDRQQCLSHLKMSVATDDYFDQRGRGLSYLTLGCIYKRGEWIKVDYSIAAHCYSRAAILGHHQGIIEVAKLVEKGKIAIADVHTAIQLYRAIIDSTNISNQVQALAMKRLGQLYLKMKTTTSQYRGRQWINQALNKFQLVTYDPLAKCCAYYQIARIHHKGLSTDKENLEKASIYYRKVLTSSSHCRDVIYPRKAEIRLKDLDLS